MADLSQMPLEDLMRLREQMATQPVAAPDQQAQPEQAAPDLAGMPMEQLIALRDQMRGAQPAAPQSTAMDVAKSAGSGLVKGAAGVAGMVGDAASALGKGSDWLAEKITGQAVPSAMQRNPVAEAIGSDSIARGIDKVTGAPVTSYEPQTTAGKYAKTAGEFVPAALLGPGNMARNAVMGGVLPGLASEAAGQATEGTRFEPYARTGAALAAVLAPSAARRLATPMPISPERQAMVNVLRNEGVDLTAGQVTGSKPLRYAESILGESPGAGGQVARMQERQGEQFTAAAMRRAGTNATAAPDNMALTRDRIGKTFDDLSARNTLRADPALGGDINQALQTYAIKLPPEQKKLVGDEAVAIIQRLQSNGGTLAGKEYQKIRSDLTRRVGNNKVKDPDFADALRGLRNALDDNMARSISPADADAWKTANREYANMKVLEKAATGAGENAAMGIISPAQLRQAAVTQDRAGYARGKGDFADLARAGAAIMSPLPNSGTAQRGNIGNILATALGVGGASTMNPALAIAGAAAPGVAGRILHSKPVQGYLGNQRFKPAGNADQQLIQALMAARSANLPASR